MAASLAKPPPAGEIESYVHRSGEGSLLLNLMVDDAHCGACVRKIESRVNAVDGVEQTRLNLTTRRLAVTWHGSPKVGDDIVAALTDLGYQARPYDPSVLGVADESTENELLRSMSVAGFAAANVMLLSISVWAETDMGPSTRALFHGVSALIAVPTLIYAGRPFFRSALRALMRGHTNMDVPISVAVLLAGAMSVFEAIRDGEHVYFESVTMLLFFLLLGRYLDRRARGKARQAAENLLNVDRGSLTVIDDDGETRTLPSKAATVGMSVLVATGERICVDGRVTEGTSEIDASLITGECLPQPLACGDLVFAGAINIGAPVVVKITAVGDDTLLAEVVRLLESAEQRRGRYVVLADRIAGYYTPVVHALALLTFLGWTLVAGLAWPTALVYAIAVLIITCPCALGLAVPAVQVIASGQLFRRGILLKSGTALERLAQVDTVVFDKTGTLTKGRPILCDDPSVSHEDLEVAAALAVASKHPLAKAIASAAPSVSAISRVEEVPGMGLRWQSEDGEVRLGNRRWCNVEAAADKTSGLELWLVRSDGKRVRFSFEDSLRDDTKTVIADLERLGLRIAILSGDRAEAVRAIASTVGVRQWYADLGPAEKARRLQQFAADGRRVLMVGDGLNDAVALAAAHMSLSPASAVDISQATADAVFQGAKLSPVRQAIEVALEAGMLVRQNLALALAYNLVAIPVAVCGLVTPLIAAVSMSASSLIVVGNALRLTRRH